MDNYQNEISSNPIISKKQITSYDIKQLLIRIGLLIILITAYFLLPVTTLKIETISSTSSAFDLFVSARVSPEGNGIMSFSLSKLAFDVGVDEEIHEENKYVFENFDVGDYQEIYEENKYVLRNIKENHKSTIGAVLAISFICISICGVFVIKSIFHILKKNSFKASSSIAMAFIPITLANLSLIILIIATMNYAKPDSTLNYDIIGKAYPSIFFFILLAVTILTNVNSFKTIPRT